MNEAPLHEPPAYVPFGTYALVDLHNGRSYPLQPGPNSIGRSPQSRVVLEEEAVSRRHAVLMIHEDGKCEVGDADSQNGVFLNGKKLRGIARLALGDLLQISCNRLVFTKQNANDPSPFTFTDKTLGVVIWNAQDACWHFGLTLGVNWFVPATYTPPGREPPSSSPEWEGVRACVRRVKSCALEILARMLTRRSSIETGKLPGLYHIIFTTAAATFVYHHSVAGSCCVSIDQTGNFLSGLQWIPNVVDYED